MFLYLLCYTVIGLFLYNFENRKYQKSAIFICILLLSLLAGFRSSSVGTDVQIYAESISAAAGKISNFKRLRYFLFDSSYHVINGVESGYLLVAFVGRKLFGGLFGTLFLTAFIINTGVFFGLYRIREHLSFNIAILIYCFMFYQNTYNLMRQWMALAVIIFGLRYIYDKKLFKYILTIAIAMSFHTTAILGLLLYFVYAYTDKYKNQFCRALVLVSIVMVVVCYKQIITFLISNGLVSSKYIYYSIGNNVSIFIPELIIRLPAILLCGVMYKPMYKTDEHHNYWYLIMLMEVILSQLHSVTDFAARLSLYFCVSRVIEMATACRVGDSNSRLISKSLVMTYSILYWFVMYVYFDFGETYPYTSSILHI